MPLSKTFTKWAPFSTFFKKQTASDGEDGQQKSVKQDEKLVKETTSPTWYHNLLLHRLKAFRNLTTESCNTIPLNILAFRRITRMLSLVPHSTESEQPFPAVDSFADTENADAWTTIQRRELRISNALSHLIVAEHDVVAVATNHGAYHRVAEEQTKEEQAANSLGVMGTVSGDIQEGKEYYDVTVTRNDVKSEPYQAVPSVIIPVEPPEFAAYGGLSEYMEYLEANWYLQIRHSAPRCTYAFYRKEPTLPSHLWILSRLLTDRSTPRSEQHKRLYKYMLSFCCRKMNRRLQTHQSDSYFDALEKIGNFQFRPSSQQEPAAPKVSSKTAIQDAIQNDYDFLCALWDIYIHSPSQLPESGQIPNILRKAEAAYSTYGAGKSPDHVLYSEATCWEFHLIFIHILKAFRVTVGSLAEMSESASADDKSIQANFKNEVTDGRRNGYLLMRLAHSKAYELYLENIEPLLAAQIRSEIASLPPGEKLDQIMKLEDAISIKTASREEEWRILEEIEVLPPVQMHLATEGLLAKAYKSWLRLLVVHFGASEVVLEFVNDTRQFPYDAISVRLLVAPTSGLQSLPWTGLFALPEFPAVDEDGKDQYNITNTEIETFLKKGIVQAHLNLQAHELAKKANYNLKKGQFRGIKNTLNVMSDAGCLSVPASLLRQSISAELQKNRKTDPKVQKTIADGIVELLRLCPGRTAGDTFYLKLEEDDNFGGALHCEVFLATLLDDAHYGDHWPLQHSDMKVSIDFTFSIAKLIFCIYRATGA